MRSRQFRLTEAAAEKRGGASDLPRSAALTHSRFDGELRPPDEVACHNRIPLTVELDGVRNGERLNHTTAGTMVEYVSAVSLKSHNITS